MKFVLLTALLMLPSLGFSQGLLESYKIKKDSLNKVNFQRLKTKGEFDAKKMRTGFWIEYEILHDSVQSTPATVQLGDTSIVLNFPHPTKLQKKEGNYRNGLMDNRWKWFEAIYDDNDDLSWEIRKETEFINGIKNGIEIEYRLFEAVYKKSTYVNDQLDGDEYIYSERDVIAFKIHYKKGVEQMITWYFENGKPKVVENYELSPITVITKYHENGLVWAIYSVKGGEIDGQALVYDDEGNLVERKSFSNGVEMKK